MNHDIMHCPNIKCPQASTCRRSTIHFTKFPPPTKWISYAGFSPDPETGVCEHYWPLDTIELDIQTKQEQKKMTPEEIAKLPPTKRRLIAGLVYREMLKKEAGQMKNCFGCGDNFPARTFCEINDNGDELCERCIFILALYTQQGIKKRLIAGSLNPHKLNSKFRKIVEEDFYLNPVNAYQTYLGDMIQQEEAKQRIIWITPEDFRKIENDFPFYLMTAEQYQQFKPTEGAELTLRIKNPEPGQTDTIKRRIYAIHKTTKRAAKKYSGSADRNFVCFIPENYDK